MVFVMECVGDTFAASVAHDDLDASIMLKGWADVAGVECMKNLWQLLVGFMMCQYLSA
jgi:hypothetical protein